MLVRNFSEHRESGRDWGTPIDKPGLLIFGVCRCPRHLKRHPESKLAVVGLPMGVLQLSIHPPSWPSGIRKMAGFKGLRRGHIGVAVRASALSGTSIAPLILPS
jgi:hypothetical protein